MSFGNFAFCISSEANRKYKFIARLLHPSIRSIRAFIHKHGLYTLLNTIGQDFHTFVAPPLWHLIHEEKSFAVDANGIQDRLVLGAHHGQDLQSCVRMRKMVVENARNARRLEIMEILASEILEFPSPGLRRSLQVSGPEATAEAVKQLGPRSEGRMTLQC